MNIVIKKIYYLSYFDTISIKKQMLDLGLNLTSFANKVNCSKAYLSALINGKKALTKKALKYFDSVGIVILFD